MILKINDDGITINKATAFTEWYHFDNKEHPLRNKPGVYMYGYFPNGVLTNPNDVFTNDIIYIGETSDKMCNRRYKWVRVFNGTNHKQTKHTGAKIWKKRFPKDGLKDLYYTYWETDATYCNMLERILLRDYENMFGGPPICNTQRTYNKNNINNNNNKHKGIIMQNNDLKTNTCIGLAQLRDFDTLDIVFSRYSNNTNINSNNETEEDTPRHIERFNTIKNKVAVPEYDYDYELISAHKICQEIYSRVSFQGAIGGALGKELAKGLNGVFIEHHDVQLEPNNSFLHAIHVIKGGDKYNKLMNLKK